MTPNDEVDELVAECERLNDTITRARFVADYWRRGILSMENSRGWEAHPLCMVLAALDGETDPAQVGVKPEDWLG